MSYRDELTSLYNRNKYIKIVNSYRHQPIEKAGAIYLDLNGLKAINDKKGHEAGDAMICAAARTICEVYPENTYRIGGDEFVVLVSNVEKAEFEENIHILRDKLKKQNISISIGALWQERCENLDELLKEADQRMYKEKSLYYQE